MKNVLSVIVGLLAVSAQARSMQLTRGTTGMWSDPTMWYDEDGKTNDILRAGDKAKLTAYWDIDVTLDEDVSMPLNMIISSRAGNTLSLLCDGQHVLESKGDDIVAKPFYLYTPSNHCLQYERAAGSGTAYRFDNPELTVSNVNDVSYFDFHSGTFNFYDPNGYTNDVAINLFVASSDAAEIIFGKDASARLGSTTLAGNGKETVGDVALRFEGGSHYLKEIRWNPAYAPPRKMEVSAKGGAHLTAESVAFTNSINSAGAVAGDPIHAVLDLSDGARLDVGSSGLVAEAKNKYIEPEVRLHNATLASDGTADLQFKLSANPSTNRFVAVDSTVAWSYGVFTCGYFASSSARSGSLGAFTNSTFVAKRFNFYTGANYVFKDCHVESMVQDASNFGNRCASAPDAEVVFDHCTLTNLNLKSYPNGFTGTMRFTGGTQADLWDLYLTCAADVRIDGGSRVDCMVGSSVNRVVCNGQGTAILTVSNATLTATKANLFLAFSGPGADKDGCGILRVQDGAEVNIGGKDSVSGCILYVGYKGRGRLEVSGGKIWANSIYVGNQTKDYESAEHSVLHMTGGEVHAHVNDDYKAVTFGNGTNHAADFIFDGGTLYTPRMYGCGNGPTKLSANGGTFVAMRDVTGRGYAIISGFDTAELGPKGLTVDVQGNAFMTQSMANKSGENGLFRKTGPKTLTLTPETWSVSETRVEEGALLISDATKTLQTTLVVTNGAALSLAGTCTALTLDGLVVANGLLELDAGDTITVPVGNLAVSGLQLKFSANPAAATTNTFLVTTGGEIPADVQWELRRAYIDNSMPADNHSFLIFDYDSETGVTSVRMAVTADASPLTDETAWRSATSDGWATPASWTAGVPNAAKIAAFSEAAGVSKTVEVPPQAMAGAVAFRADGYTLQGGRLEIAADQGAARISTESGTNTVKTALRLDSETAITNASASKLTLAGNVEGFGFDKTGHGELELAGTNAFYRPVSQNAGRILVRTPAALGADDVEKRVTLTGGTIAFDAADGKAMRIENPITVSAPATRSAAIIECRTPVTLANWQTTTQGGLIKRGGAALTIEVGGDIQLNAKCSMTAISYVPATEFTFAADGTAPDGASLPNNGHYYAGFNVAEGEVAFRAKPGLAARPKITSKCAVMSCLRTKDGTVGPSLTLDGVDLDLSGGNYLLNGDSLSSDRVFCQSPVIRIVNGARAYGKYLQCKRYGYSAGSQPIWAITNGTLQAKSEFWFDYINVDGVNLTDSAYSVFKTKDAEILSDTGVFYHNGGVRGDFANTYLGPTDKTAYGTLSVPSVTAHNSYASGEMLFRDGSVFRIGAFSFPISDWKPATSWAVMKIAFDGAEWQYGDGDWTLQAAWFAEGYRDHFAVEARGRGLILKPAAGTTFTTEMPITGDGPVVVDGPGTVKFNAGTFKAGCAEVRQGTFDAAGEAVKVRLVPGETVPTLKDCNKSMVLVDMGGIVCAKGDTFAVAHISGSTPGRFKAVNFADSELHGYFSIQDGAVTMTVDLKPGQMIIVR